ncbi:hypothetical protein E1287_37685 [Actinomadura sp. KC06]|uniref:hypothetical protein n=1 Tax=Actinomadura sp. KC06 TaxID=2530369 RepID=UPI0010429235|nr:hypothetical protein [Actinomadura sp. KC06]TDD24996.1 hypothetical protein E1287_37685 [Actinomadura sp. KC06]
MNATGWAYERGTNERVDDDGNVVTEPTDNAWFVCHDHNLASGALPVAEALEFARAHLTEQHPEDELEALP